jgi:hypothetical protein
MSVRERLDTGLELTEEVAFVRVPSIQYASVELPSWVIERGADQEWDRFTMVAPHNPVRAYRTRRLCRLCFGSVSSSHG